MEIIKCFFPGVDNWMSAFTYNNLKKKVLFSVLEGIQIKKKKKAIITYQMVHVKHKIRSECHYNHHQNILVYIKG